VEGTVTKDGLPLRGIEVVFLPDADTVGPRASGLTDEAGHYRLRTDNGDDGAVVGKHRVLIRDVNEAAIMRALSHTRGAQSKESKQLPPEMAERLKEHLRIAADAVRVPPTYGRFNETPLRVEFQPGPQVIHLEVK